MAFLDQWVDEYLPEKMNGFSIFNFRSSQLFDSICFANDRIVEKEMNFAVTYCQSWQKSLGFFVGVQTFSW
jgi:hypothetical protein